MTEFAAVDLGAESGRVVRGRFDGERGALSVEHRFENRPVRLPDGLRWNLLALFTEVRSRGCEAWTRTCPVSASIPGASTTRCSIPSTGCSGFRSTTATRARTGWSTGLM